MPKNLEDLRLVSREYMKNLGIIDEFHDEQVYLKYIEDHLHAQEKLTIIDENSNSRMTTHTLSPIRNLADFYQKKLKKIQGHNESFYKSTSRSPKHCRQNNAINKTFVDIG